jgi:hypothetical protein
VTDENDDPAAHQPLSSSWEEYEATRKAEEHPDAAAVSARLENLNRSFEDLLTSFPEHQRDAAARGVYIDGDGNAATRYGRLRPL